MMAHFQDLQNKVNFLSYAREFYDPESGETFLKDHLLEKDDPLQSSTIQRIWHLLLKI